MIFQEKSKIFNLIKDEKLREFVYTFLSRYVSEEFWFAPSSSTGKYHPPEDNGTEGLLRHTLKAVQVGLDLCRLYEINIEDRDIIISAILLHDTAKNIKDGKWGIYTNYEHGKIGADIIRKIADEEFDSVYEGCISYKTYEKIQQVAHLVEIHMGRWAKPEPYHNKFRKRLEQIVIESDYIASRKGISFRVEEVKDE